jgi:hypothetical protein
MVPNCLGGGKALLTRCINWPFIVPLYIPGSMRKPNHRGSGMRYKSPLIIPQGIDSIRLCLSPTPPPPPPEDSWYSFLLEAESTPGP